MAQIIDENGLKYNFRFIVVEGPDGVGKSTMVTKICQAMMGNGVPYIKTHFPNHHIAPLDKDGTFRPRHPRPDLPRLRILPRRGKVIECYSSIYVILQTNQVNLDKRRIRSRGWGD